MDKASATPQHTKAYLKLLRELLTYPALFSGTRVCFDDIWRVHAYVEA